MAYISFNIDIIFIIGIEALVKVFHKCIKTSLALEIKSSILKE